MNTTTFSNIAIVSCGTMSLEINALKSEGFLDTEHLYFTPPGLHQDIVQLEKHLVQQIDKAKKTTEKVIVVYGGKFCYVNADNPTRMMKDIINEQGSNVARVDATHCMGMLASDEEMHNIAQELAGGEPVWWMTPGWVKFRHQVFKGWDKGLANENFPRHTGGAIVLDGVGYMDQYMEEDPEGFLEYCDWMGIPMQAYNISLERFKGLLIEQLKKIKKQ
ncbi:conserved hypothetical protein [Desulfamplus magnetovallimortis]|uniref:DUF1638 domain-containing protein n=1 Tax=Desulfamplus magnetovallimortis TaxID=1246637 RepID=A0A1W1H6J2_9BACT|nr:DUF1638 domain-containing protein [Desulfamplus magnetovallimortis]SLM28082.1 conserved hypothetical protein [Desulfamplus magnetovallimortis]